MTNLMNCDWDDTELIEMWDKSMENTKRIVSHRLSGTYSGESVPLTTFAIGTPCRAVYDEDNIEYEATIQEIEDDEYVIVKFIGYENEQRVAKTELKKSYGLQARKQQEYDAKLEENIEDEIKGNLSDRKYSSIPQPPPALLPHISSTSDEEFTAINAMINAWYMSGYYTGYYQAVKARNNKL